MIRRLFLAVAAAVLVSACAGPVPQIAASSSQLQGTRTVAVVRPPEPRTYTVMNFGHPGMAFGLIGGLVASSDMATKQDRLTTAFKADHAAVCGHLAEEVAAKLAAAGYEARVIDAPWAEVEGRYQLPFDKIEADADAVVVLSPTIIGFIATGITSDYLPTLTTVVTMLGKDRKAQMYRGFHAYGWTPKADGWRSTAPKTTFANFDALMGDTSASLRALDAGGTAIAESIAADLRR